MAGYEILFSMVVCLLFAFGFASLRAVRALFFVKDTFSVCIHLFSFHFFNCMFFSLSISLFLSFFLPYSFFRLLQFFIFHSLCLSFTLMFSSFMSPFFFSSCCCCSSVTCLVVIVLVIVVFAAATKFFWYLNICINDTRAQQSNKSNLVWG